jgi:hypothetical protein
MMTARCKIVFTHLTHLQIRKIWTLLWHLQDSNFQCGTFPSNQQHAHEDVDDKLPSMALDLGLPPSRVAKKERQIAIKLSVMSATTTTTTDETHDDHHNKNQNLTGLPPG